MVRISRYFQYVNLEEVPQKFNLTTCCSVYDNLDERFSIYLGILVPQRELELGQIQILQTHKQWESCEGFSKLDDLICLFKRSYFFCEDNGLE